MSLKLMLRHEYPTHFRPRIQKACSRLGLLVLFNLKLDVGNMASVGRRHYTYHHTLLVNTCGYSCTLHRNSGQLVALPVCVCEPEVWYLGPRHLGK